MKERHKILVTLLLTSVIFTSNLFGTVVNASATNEKEEVVYVNLNNEGKMNGTYVVNIFNGKEIVDYGNYSKVKNLSTEDKITYKDGKVSVKNSADKLYYEGILEDVILPWNFDITYQLDGKAIKGKELAGKSGHLVMKLDITENKNAKDIFFENYAVQTTIKFDTNLCKNIKSEGAMQANVGNIKQLVYTILSGKEKEITIETDVTDFEMSEISLNGIRLELGMDKNMFDTSKLTDKTDDVKSAATELNNGASKLKDGSEKLKDGSSNLYQGMDTLEDGISEYTNGVHSVSQGVKSLYDGTNALSNGTKSLANGTEQLVSGTERLSGAAKELANGMTTFNNKVKEITFNKITLSEEAISKIKSNIAQSNELVGKGKELAAGVSANVAEKVSGSISDASTIQVVKESLLQTGLPENVCDQLAAGICANIANNITSDSINNETLQNIMIESLKMSAETGAVSGAQGVVAEVNNNFSSVNGKVEELKNASNMLTNGINDLSSGTETLLESTKEVNNGTNTIMNGANGLADGTDNLLSGVSMLEKNSSKLNIGSSALVVGTKELKNGIGELFSGTNKLAEGTDKFKKETSTMDKKIEEEIEQSIDNLSKKDFVAESFVSDKNKNVKSVQFVMKTSAIEIEEAEEEEVEEEKKTGFLQKIKNLF